ncbi:MAG: hypothetical protein VYB73_02380 [Verrucomicrobiota bacterium]|nr:hypothetical protein [Verrucomicrobiota bacterium]
MTLIGFTVRRLLKSIGLCNKQNHDIIASRLVHLLSEKEETLGSNAWENTNEIVQLSKKYWELKELFHEQENLEMEANDIRNRNDHLTHETDELTVKSESSMLAATNGKNALIQKSIELNNEIKSQEIHCETKKNEFIALSMNLKESKDEGEVLDTQKNIEHLKDAYTQGRQEIGKLKLQIKENDLKVERTEEKLKDLKIKTRNQISAAMNKVTKSAKLVADYSAKIGAIESAKKGIYMEIGSFLSANENTNNPKIIGVLDKNKLILDQIKGLKKSIKFHRVLGT